MGDKVTTALGTAEGTGGIGALVGIFDGSTFVSELVGTELGVCAIFASAIVGAVLTDFVDNTVGVAVGRLTVVGDMVDLADGIFVVGAIVGWTVLPLFPLLIDIALSSLSVYICVDSTSLRYVFVAYGLRRLIG